MRPSQRDILLILLAITSGSADGWSFFGLGHVFVANMTGNTVLLGVAVFGENHDVIHPMVALGSYAFGVAIGTILTRNVKPGSTWARAVSWVLLLEALFLIVAEAGWFALRGRPHSAERSLLIACIAIGIGLQSGGMLPLRLPGIVTTYISGTWTTLVSGLVLVSQPDQKRVPHDKTAFEERLLLQIVFLAFYFLAALLAGFILRYVRLLMGAICVLPILIVVTYSLLIENESRAQTPTRRTTP